MNGQEEWEGTFGSFAGADPVEHFVGVGGAVVDDLGGAFGGLEGGDDDGEALQDCPEKNPAEGAAIAGTTNVKQQDGVGDGGSEERRQGS